MALIPVPDSPAYGGIKWFRCDRCGRYVAASEAINGECPQCGGTGEWPDKPEPVTRPATLRVVMSEDGLPYFLHPDGRRELAFPDPAGNPFRPAPSGRDWYDDD